MAATTNISSGWWQHARQDSRRACDPSSFRNHRHRSRGIAPFHSTKVNAMRTFATLLLCLSTLPAHAQNRDDRYFVDWAGPTRGDVARTVRCRAPLQCVRGRHGIRAQRHRIIQQEPMSLAQGVRRELGDALARAIGGRPNGCPRAFCGCGASLHLFGRIIPSLNLAANWLRFPRTAPAPKMAAVRRGHVFVLEQHIAGNVWLVHDSNSGGGRTHLHPRSIAGYAIVNPHGG